MLFYIFILFIPEIRKPLLPDLSIMISLVTRRMASSHRVAVLLAGSGVYDGTEVHEASAALVALSRANAQVSMFAPDKEQLHAIDHTKGSDFPTLS